MPKWFPWVLGLIALVIVFAWFASRDIQAKLDEARDTAKDAKAATDTVDKYAKDIQGLGDAWGKVSSLWK